MHAVRDGGMEKIASIRHVPGEASAMVGAKLAALVCNLMRVVFRSHRRALKNNNMLCKDREPGESAVMLMGVAGERCHRADKK